METILTIKGLTDRAFSKVFKFAYVNKIIGGTWDEGKMIDLVIDEYALCKFSVDKEKTLILTSGMNDTLMLKANEYDNILVTLSDEYK